MLEQLLPHSCVLGISLQQYENDLLWLEFNCAKGPHVGGLVTDLSHYWKMVELLGSGA